MGGLVGWGGSINGMVGVLSITAGLTRDLYSDSVLKYWPDKATHFVSLPLFNRNHKPTISKNKSQGV